jgi:hypothetical protein
MKDEEVNKDPLHIGAMVRGSTSCTSVDCPDVSKGYISGTAMLQLTVKQAKDACIRVETLFVACAGPKLALGDQRLPKQASNGH